MNGLCNTCFHSEKACFGGHTSFGWWIKMKFNVGDIISANDPLVHVIDPTKKNRICDYCMSYG